MKNRDVLLDFCQYHKKNVAAFVQQFQTESIQNKKIHGLFGHCLNAHQIWNARIHGTQTVEPFEEVPTESYHSRAKSFFADTKDILLQREISELIHYKSTSKIAYSNSIQEIINHLWNHYTYHFGQINYLLVAENQSAISMDYIRYKRKENV